MGGSTPFALQRGVRLKLDQRRLRHAQKLGGEHAIGDYPAAGTPYWLTMAGVAALGLVGVALMLSVV